MTPDGTDPDSPDEPASGGLTEFVDAYLQSAESSNTSRDTRAELTPELLNVLHRGLHDGLTLLAEPELVTAIQWDEDWGVGFVEVFFGVTLNVGVDDLDPEWSERCSAWRDEVFSREGAAEVRRLPGVLWEFWDKNEKYMTEKHPAELPNLDDWHEIVELARGTLAVMGERPDGPDVWGVQDLRRLSETH
jgi:hypothetical protein